MDPELAIEKVTPRTAEHWLAGMAANRGYREYVAERYAQDMRDGRWRVNGVPLIFDADGHLMDGQHRLHAVIKAEKPQTFVIARGVPQADMATIDTGLARRLADFLRLQGESHVKPLAATLNNIWRWDHNATLQPSPRQTQPTIQQALEFFDGHADEFRYAVMLGSSASRNCLISSSLVATLYTLFSAHDEADSDDFFERLAKGADMGERHPIMALRRRLIDNKASQRKLNPYVVGALVIKAWNAYREGRDVQNLVWRAGGKNPEPFPSPV